MANLLKLGTVAERTATTRYDLLDTTTAGNIFLLDNGMKPERWDGDLKAMRFKLKSAPGTNAQIQAAEEKIQDHFIAARKYDNDMHRSEPVFLWFNADGITERKRCIVRGELKPLQYRETNELLNYDTVFYELVLWCYPPWEGATETTEINATTMDGVTSSIEMTSLLGDVPGRISELTIRATSTNDEDAPLVNCIIGIRPEYASMDNFNPIWNLGYSTAQAADTVLASTDSNVYPVGTTQNNYMSCDFDTFTTDVTRTSIRMEDIWINEATEKVLHGGAEGGSTTDWTSTYANGVFTASNANPRTGTWHFRGYSTVVGSPGGLSQDIGITAGNTYYYSIASELNWWLPTTIGSSVVKAYLTWHTSVDAQVGVIAGRSLNELDDAADGSYQFQEGFSVAPSNSHHAKVTMAVANTDATTLAGATSFDIDDVSLKQVYADDYEGDYLVLLRCRVDTGEVDVYAKFGYEGTATRSPIGATQKVIHTDWKFVPLGVVSIPPERRLTDEESYWRISKLTFDISAEEVSGTPTLDMDALIFIPWEHGLYVEDVSIAQSSYEITGGEYNQSDLHYYQTALDEVVLIAEDESFEGVDTAIRYSANNFRLPAEDSLLVAFCQRDGSHQIADDFKVTLKYYPRYYRRYSD